MGCSGNIKEGGGNNNNNNNNGHSDTKTEEESHMNQAQSKQNKSQGATSNIENPESRSQANDAVVPVRVPGSDNQEDIPMSASQKLVQVDNKEQTAPNFDTEPRAQGEEQPVAPLEDGRLENDGRL